MVNGSRTDWSAISHYPCASQFMRTCGRETTAPADKSGCSGDKGLHDEERMTYSVWLMAENPNPKLVR